MKLFFRKTTALFTMALLLFSFVGCDFLYERAIKEGVNAEFQAVKNAATSEELPDSRIVNTIIEQISFPGAKLSDAQTKELTQALLKNFDAQVESVKINSKNKTATALCRMSNINMNTVASNYGLKAANLTDDELIALTWTGKSEQLSGSAFERYMEAIESADLTDRMESSLTISLKLEGDQWVPDFPTDLSSAFYNAVLGGYTDSLTEVQTPLILASYNALFAKLSGISAEEFVAEEYIRHPLLAYMKDSLSTELSDEQLTEFCVALLKNFHGTADSVTFEKDAAYLNGTFTNGNMVIAMNQTADFIASADERIEAANERYTAGRMTYAQLEAEADKILADLYDQYFEAIKAIPKSDFITQTSPIPLSKSTDMWVPNQAIIKGDYGLFNAMFGNLLTTSRSETDNYSPIYSS